MLKTGLTEASPNLQDQDPRQKKPNMTRIGHPEKTGASAKGRPSILLGFGGALVQ